MLIKIIITCTNTITRLTVASHPQRCFLVTVKISPYKKKSPAKWKTIAISLPDNFIRSRSLPVFVLVLRLWHSTRCRGQANADDTLVVEASTPSLYAPQQSADPKFSRPVADTTRTMTVISEQVIKDQGATNLTDALKNVPGVGAFFAGENGNSTTGDAIYMRGADTSNSIYIDGIRDIGSVSRDTFNTEQVEVIKGPSGTDYGAARRQARSI